jgi:hypothetical protein
MAFNRITLMASHMLVPAIGSLVDTIACDSCPRHKAHAAPRNITPCTKPTSPLLQVSSDMWGSFNVPSPYGLRYCFLAIDHHTHGIWVRILKSKDETCSSLEAILFEIELLRA